MLRIKELRSQKKISQQKLADLLGVSRSAVSMWEIDASQPDNDTLLKLSEILNISVDYLLGRSDEPGTHSSNAIKIPVLGNVAAGLPISAVENILDYEEISEDMARTGEFFALRIHGNSMEPKYRDGDILLVEECDYVEYGELGIFILDGDGYFKKYGGDRLISLNPEYSDILLRNFDEISCCGRVVGKLKRK